MDAECFGLGLRPRSVRGPSPRLGMIRESSPFMSRVFLLADDARIRADIELELRRSQHLVHSRGTNRFFVGDVRAFAPEVIILDCANESAAAQARLAILRDAQLAGVPLVAIAHSSEEAHAFGAQGLLPRPLHPGD